MAKTNFEKFLYLDGDNTNRALAEISGSGQSVENEILNEMDVLRRNNKEGIVFIPGMGSNDVELFKEGSMCARMIEEMPHSIIINNWAAEADFNPTLNAAQLEDACKALGIDSIHILGISFGGYFALRFIRDIFIHRVNLEIKSLSTIVSVFDPQDLGPKVAFDEKIIDPLFWGAEVLSNLTQRPVPHRLIEKRKSHTRLKAIQDGLVLRGEVPANIPVLAVTTKGKPLIDGIPWLPPTPDFMANNRRSAARLSSVFDNVEIMEVAGRSLIRWTPGKKKLNPYGAHIIASEDSMRASDRIIDFIKSNSGR